MIGLFSVFEVMDLKGITWRSFTVWVSTNSHGCFIVTFLALHVFYIDVKHANFVTLMKYILEVRVTLFCENVYLLTR
jgi:hypothetical protein